MIGSSLIVGNILVAAVLLGTPVSQESKQGEMVSSSSFSSIPTPPQEGVAVLPVLVEKKDQDLVVRGRPEKDVVLPSTEAVTAVAPTEVNRITIPILEDGTVLEAMRTYDTGSDAFTFSGKEYPGIGFFVQEINGKREGDGYYWMLYQNGKTANLGASQLRISSEDTIEWRFEKGY